VEKEVVKFSREILHEVMDLSAGESENGFTLVEQGEWVSDGKYDLCHWIFQHDNKFYQINDSRTGSYYSDYYHESEDWDDLVECSEVEKVEVIRHEWKPKK
jgi:hypothetical protein